MPTLPTSWRRSSRLFNATGCLMEERSCGPYGAFSLPPVLGLQPEETGTIGVPPPPKGLPQSLPPTDRLGSPAVDTGFIGQPPRALQITGDWCPYHPASDTRVPGGPLPGSLVRPMDLMGTASLPVLSGGMSGPMRVTAPERGHVPHPGTPELTCHFVAPPTLGPLPFPLVPLPA